VEQGKTGGLAVEKGVQRLESPLGSEAIASQVFLGPPGSLGGPVGRKAFSDRAQRV
jgi:hypothetical protein